MGDSSCVFGRRPVKRTEECSECVDPEPVIGLLFSVIVGWAVTRPFQDILEIYIRLPGRSGEIHATGRIPPDMTGTLERIFFTLMVAFDISGTATAMIAWMALKMTAHWNSPEAAKMGSGDREIVTRRFSALITGMVSLTIAVIGGLTWKGRTNLYAMLWITVGVIPVSIVIRLIFRRKRRGAPVSPTLAA